MNATPHAYTPHTTPASPLSYEARTAALCNTLQARMLPAALLELVRDMARELDRLKVLH